MWMPAEKSTYFESKYPELCPTDPEADFQQYGRMGCVGIGWFDRLDQMCEELSALGFFVQLTCVKQKFGKLRVHFDYNTGNTEQLKQIQAIVQRTEEECNSMCSMCGVKLTEQQLSRLYGIGYICDSCRQKHLSALV